MDEGGGELFENARIRVYENPPTILLYVLVSNPRPRPATSTIVRWLVCATLLNVSHIGEPYDTKDMKNDRAQYVQ